VHVGSLQKRAEAGRHAARQAEHVIVEVRFGAGLILVDVGVALVIDKIESADTMAGIDPVRYLARLFQRHVGFDQDRARARITDHGALCRDHRQVDSQIAHVGANIVEGATGTDGNRHAGRLHGVDCLTHNIADCSMFVGVDDRSVQIEDDQVKGCGLSHDADSLLRYEQPG
jgi:hypothetical protein